jgi:hypothetical protein
MGQECCQTSAPIPRRINVLEEEDAEPISPFLQLESDSTLNKSSHSQMAIRTSNLRKMNSNLSTGVKSRLQQLPSISQSARNAEEGRRVYIDRLEAYYQGELLNGLPHGKGFLQFDCGDYL